MRKFRKKPVVIEAVHFLGNESLAEIINFMENNLPNVEAFNGNIERLTIETLEGNMTALIGDWIIKGISGEFYPCKNEIFLATYEPAEI
jgi:hypothetical protein